MFLSQDDIMRRKAHDLMWPGKLYVPDKPPPAFLQRDGSLRQIPKGVLQDMPSNHNRRFSSPNRPQLGMGSSGQLQIQPAAKVPSPNRVRRVSAPGRPQDAAREPYKPLVKPTAQYAVQPRQPYAAGVQYESAKPVKDAIQRFERK
jgi:hypothetical protein